MSLREKLNISRAPLTDYAEWKKKFRRSVIILAAITFIPVIFIYSLLFSVILSR